MIRSLPSLRAPVSSRRVPPERANYGIQYRVVHGHRRAFVMAGSGPVLLLIHGIGDSSDTWERVIPELSRDHTVIAPDLLGHGRSDKPRADYSVAAYANAMRDLLSVLDIDRATLVGHSLGGGIAMQFAYQYPAMCERLVLVSTGGVSKDVNPLLRLCATPVGELVLRLLELPAARRIGGLATLTLRALGTDLGRDAEDLVRMFDALPNRTSRTAFVRTLRAVVDLRGQVVTMLDRSYLAEGVPVLLLWGEHDGVIPSHHARLAHQALPGSRLEIVPEAGHFPHRSDPEHFVRTLADFVRGTNAASYDTARWREILRRGRLPAAVSAQFAPADGP